MKQYFILLLSLAFPKTAKGSARRIPTFQSQLSVGALLAKPLSVSMAICLSFLSISTFTQNSFALSEFSQIEKVEPENWWVGMKDSSLQLLIYGNDIGGLDVRIPSAELELTRVERVASSNYLFLYLDVTDQAKAGVHPIELLRDGEVVERIEYQLSERRENAALVEGFDPSDVIYLLMPDRFANGDPTNDSVPGMHELTVDRSDPYGRHGGDLRGIIKNLDYFKELGVTALWLNPIMENNHPRYSYHGYAITDFYKVDPRYGSNADYQELTKKAAEKGIKIVMDMIFNHCGYKHWWMEDLPEEDWINSPDDIRITSHRRTANLDLYASKSDVDLLNKGWFVEQMPDLNMGNDLMADYMIQNSIWWTEFLGLGGIRVDTYPYPDKHGMAKWAKRMMLEYPNFNITGEEWSENPIVVSYWQDGKVNPDGYQGGVPSMLDFPLQVALENAFKADLDANGLTILYEMLANDVVYPTPGNLVTFLGNHDMPRFYMEVGKDLDWYKNGLVFLLTTRGIPHLYYGDEVLMTHDEGNDHGNIRKDFPGGWHGDTVNVFEGKGLKAEEIEALEFTRKILNWRKQASVVHDGKLLHFAPEDNTYVYFRYDADQMVMVVLNKNSEEMSLDLSRFAEVLGGKKLLLNVLTDEELKLGDSLTLTAKQPYIFEVR